MAAGTGTTSALTRERVVDAAIALAERDGLAELSMRRLAAELGAGTMSLYNHVSDKEDLFDGMVERVLAAVRVADSDDWREVVATWATDSRQALLDRIDLIPLVIAPPRLVHLGRISSAVGVGPRAGRARPGVGGGGRAGRRPLLRRRRAPGRPPAAHRGRVPGGPGPRRSPRACGPCSSGLAAEVAGL